MRQRDDEGFSIIEVVVTMAILSFVMAIVTGAIVELYSGMNKVDTTANARDQLTNSFRRLDKELRYATWVSTPGQVGGAWYFEYSMPTSTPATTSANPSPAATGGCRQLVLRNGVLTLASWALPGTTPGTPTTIATGLSVNGSIPPFTVYAAGSKPYASASADISGVGRGFSPEHAQVRLQFLAVQGRTSLPYDVIFTAQNNTGNTPALNDCSKGRPTV
jgi:prepilin-type N-terminal cleavage/methylation domain-containing protein